MDFYGPLLDKIKTGLDKSVLFNLYWHEVKLGFKNGLQRIWIVTILFFSMLFLLSFNNIDALNSTLIFFGFFGTIITVVTSSSSISAEVGGIADSLLSKSVKRWEYIMAKFLSQVTIVFSVYLLVVTFMVTILMGFDSLPQDLNYSRLWFFIGLIGLILIFFTSICIMFSSMFSKTVFPFLLGIITWFAFIFLFIITNYQLIYSPALILFNFKAVLDGTWDVEYWKIILFYAISPVIFILTSLGFFYTRDL